MAEREEKGQMSEWNEGDYKNLRLHKAQELINMASVVPFRKIFVKEYGSRGIYGYQLWFEGITVLFREGKSKYTSDEFQEVAALKEEIEELMVSGGDVCSKYDSINKFGARVNPNIWKPLKKLIQDYEDKVYKYNDSHGLSTRNREEDEGL